MSEETEKIKEYLEHKNSCMLNQAIDLRDGSFRCTCGLDEALALLQEKPSGEDEKDKQIQSLRKQIKKLEKLVSDVAPVDFDVKQALKETEK